MTRLARLSGTIEALSFRHHHEWMNLVVRHGPRQDDPDSLFVELMIHSSYGSWGYTWSHCGRGTWVEWLRDLDRCYMMGKLMGANIREPMDVEEAFTELKRDLVQYVRDRGIDRAPKVRQQIADVREAINFGIEVYDLSTLLTCWSNVTGRDDWDLDFQKTSPTAIQFWDCLWRPFIAELTAGQLGGAL